MAATRTVVQHRGPGGIDLSVGSILAASAMAALLASLVPDWGLLGVPAALLTGLGFGLLNGALIAFGVGVPAAE